MKTTKFFTILTLILFIQSIGFSQNLKDLKNKAKDKAKDKVENNSKDNKGSNQNNSNDSNNQSNNQQEVKADDNYSAFVDQKYSLIKSYEENLSINSCLRGEIDPTKHLAGAKKLDYPNTIKTLNEKGRKGVTGYHYDDVMDYGKKYLEAYNGTLKGLINRHIEDAYKTKQYNEKQAIEKIEAAKNLAEAATLIIPQEASTQTLFDDAKKAWDDIAGKYYAAVYTSDFHKQNAGKILFSNKPIVAGKEDSNQFSTKFTPNDHIYAIIYLNAKIKDLGNSSTYNVNIDGNESYISFKHNNEDSEKTYYTIEIMPDPKVAVHSIDPKEFGNLLSTLSPRNHQMKIDMAFGYGSSIASGEVTLDWSGADGAKIKENGELASKNAQDNWARNMKLPEVFSMQSQKFTDPDLTLEKIKTMFLNAESNAAQVLKVVITERDANYTEDWAVQKNDVGIPTNKYTTRCVYFAFKAKDGWCYYTDYVVFLKTYEGAGTYGKTHISSNIRKTKIACENVK